MLRTGEVRFIAQGDWGSEPNLSTSLSLAGDVIVAVQADFWRDAPPARRQAIIREHIAGVAAELERMALPADLMRRWAWMAWGAYTGGSGIFFLLATPPASAASATFVVAVAARFVSPRWLLLPFRPLVKAYIRRLFRKGLTGIGRPAAATAAAGVAGEASE